MIGLIDKDKKNLSTYQPSEDIRLFTKTVQDDYEQGVEILNRPWVELNDRSVVEDENRGQMMFNAFVDTSVEDPAEAWKWRGTRSMARNKAIAMHANLTANYLLPLFTAQNENDEEDRDFSEVMRDIIEWMASPVNSDYQSSFLQVVFGMMTNPVTYLGAEYCEVFQTIKEKNEKGDLTTKEILDEVLSGFHAPIWSSSQVLITNAYMRNIQKQRRIIKRRYVEHQELEAKYGQHANWDYVQAGIRSVFNSEDNMFYDVKDDDHPTLVAEEIVMGRREDIEVPYINGIYMGDDDVEQNPIKHRDNRGAPKYNITPFGYSRIGEHFYFYKSMMNAVGWDNDLYDAMSETLMNRSFLEVDAPVVFSGTDKIESDVVFPSSVVTLANKDAKVSPLLPPSNMAAGFNALRETEKSMSEGSVNETIGGQTPDPGTTAYAVSQAQNAARKLIGGTAKSLAESIIYYGDLMKDIAINHITVPQVEELVGGGMKLKYRTFLVDSKKGTGEYTSKRVKFDEDLIGNHMTEDEMKKKEIDLAVEAGYPETKNSIRLVNPEKFAAFRYLSRADIEEMFAKNQEYWQPVLLNLKQALAADPYIDQEKLSRKLMYSYFQSAGDDLIKETAPEIPGLPGVGGTGGGNPLSSMVQNKALAGAARGAAQ